MRFLISSLLLLAALPAAAQSSLYICAGAVKEYVVGAKLVPSGLFRQAPDGWEHLGYSIPFLFGLDYHPADPSTVYLAAGNGLIRATDGGRKWTILTGSDITEIRDVAVDSNASANGDLQTDDRIRGNPLLRLAGSAEHDSHRAGTVAARR